jgi:hypothetical protein
LQYKKTIIQRTVRALKSKEMNAHNPHNVWQNSRKTARLFRQNLPANSYTEVTMNQTPALNSHERSFGAFDRRAAITQDLKRAMVASPHWEHLTDALREALELIQQNVGLIVNDDPVDAKTWGEISNYARLIELALTIKPPESAHDQRAA